MLKRKFINQWTISALLIIVVTIITAQSMLLHPGPVEPGGAPYTHYNNYLIFKQSFFHLLHQQDLYRLYPEEHWDYYKYSPTFSMLIAPLALLPDSIGLFTWNLLNVLVLVFALMKLPGCRPAARMGMIAFIIIELITSIQSSQSNGLISGLIIFAFIFLERKQTAIAALFIVSTVFIKLFGIVALSLFIFYPGKLKAVAYTIFWTLFLGALPLIVVPFKQLTFLYSSWMNLLQADHSASLGLSVEGWLYSWFGIASKNLVVIAGAILFCLPLLRYKLFHELKFRIFFLSSILIWIVIFNHKAESPTFIIAAAGIATWFFSQQRKTENTVLLIIAFIFTVLSPTDIFPRSIRQQFVVPYVLKAVPCILIWCKIITDMLLFKEKSTQPIYSY